MTPTQEKVLEIMGTLAPYERMEIVADKQGKPDTVFVVRSSKFIISGGIVAFVK